VSTSALPGRRALHVHFRPCETGETRFTLSAQRANALPLESFDAG
jgi:hypothetical protein